MVPALKTPRQQHALGGVLSKMRVEILRQGPGCGCRFPSRVKVSPLPPFTGERQTLKTFNFLQEETQNG